MCLSLNHCRSQSDGYQFQSNNSVVWQKLRAAADLPVLQQVSDIWKMTACHWNDWVETLAKSVLLDVKVFSMGFPPEHTFHQWHFCYSLGFSCLSEPFRLSLEDQESSLCPIRALVQMAITFGGTISDASIPKSMSSLLLSYGCSKLSGFGGLKGIQPFLPFNPAVPQEWPQLLITKCHHSSNKFSHLWFPQLPKMVLVSQNSFLIFAQDFSSIFAFLKIWTFLKGLIWFHPCRSR